jgi:hypothetical protein
VTLVANSASGPKHHFFMIDGVIDGSWWPVSRPLIAIDHAIDHEPRRRREDEGAVDAFFGGAGAGAEAGG